MVITRANHYLLRITSRIPVVKEVTIKACLTPWNSLLTVPSLTMVFTKALHHLGFKVAHHRHNLLMVHLSIHLTVINTRPGEDMATRETFLEYDSALISWEWWMSKGTQLISI
jgi:hypothetical protein